MARSQKSGRGSKKSASVGLPLIPIVVGAVLVVAAVVIIVIANSGSKPASSTPPAVVTARAAAENVGEKQPLETGSHISVGSKGSWATDPPTSGKHYSATGIAPVPWGTVDTHLKPEQWVHNLEHGGIVVLFSCANGCAEDTAAIRSYIASAPQESDFHEVKLAAASYPVPGHRFALLAWGWRMFLDSWDPVQAASFYAAHVDRSPEAVP